MIIRLTRIGTSLSWVIVLPTVDKQELQLSVIDRKNARKKKRQYSVK